MSIQIKAPTFPESVADGTIANWLKKEGESVNQDEVIAEIETDKVVLEVLAQSDGVITKILKSEGEIVASSEIIGEFDESDETIETPVSSSEKITNEAKKENTNDESTNQNTSKKINPAAKKIISEENIDPKNINSSREDKRITKADVINHLNSNKKENVQVESSISSDDRPEKRVPMSRLRSTIAKRLVSVKQETAMLTTFNEVDMLPIKEMNLKRNMA